MSQPYTTKNYSPEESIGYLLKRAGMQLALTVDRELSEYDMTHAQLQIVFKVLHCHANTAADLARELMVDTGAMTRMLDRLEEKGFISRTRSSEDRRVVRVGLTPKGEELAGRMTEIAIKALNHHLRGFAQDEIALFKDFLRRMIANA
jgi:DNA-binding MarR family transcriptional regulator